MSAKHHHLVGLSVCIVAVLAVPAFAQGVCPLPPNPNFFPCPLAVDRSTLQEADLDLDGQPDNSGSIGAFCGGNSGADCVGFATAEVGFTVLIGDPARQSVTCSAPGLDIWFMSGGCGSCLDTGFGSATLPAGSTSFTSIKVVVADINGDVCPCGPLLTCTFDVEVACNDGADGDGDGLIDAADPDCCLDNDGDGFCGASDCDDTNANVHSVALPLETVEVTKTMGATTIQWTPRSGDFYDVVSGSLSDLRSAGSYDDAICLRNDDQDGETTDTQSPPPVGDALYYLVRAQSLCGDGGYLDSPIDPDPRDDLVDFNVCPYDPDCTSCVYTGCDLLDPDPICTGDQCFYDNAGGTACLGTTGTGTQFSPCSSPLDCAAGLTCVLSPVFGSSVCSEWCIDVGDCGPILCNYFNPPVVVDGVEYGACS